MKTPSSFHRIPAILLLAAGFTMIAAPAFAEPEDSPDPERDDPPQEGKTDPSQESLPSEEETAPKSPPEATEMTNERLAELIEEIDPDFQGQLGFWQFDYEGVPLACVTDAGANRMRIMTPIARAEDVTDEQMSECMKANFDRALDARYCVNGGVLYGAFIHPLRELTDDLFRSAVHQVRTVKLTFGSSYSSGGLQFGGDYGDEEEDEKKLPPLTDEEKGTGV